MMRDENHLAHFYPEQGEDYCRATLKVPNYGGDQLRTGSVKSEENV